LRILFGNLAPTGAVAKITGKEGTHFTGRARVFHSEEEAQERILDGTVVAGDVLVIRYEGPKGGPGMRELLITDGRFSGGTSGLSIGHVSPEAAEGGAIGLVQEGDVIEIDIPNRAINVMLSGEDLAGRRQAMDAGLGWKPVNRQRQVSAALQAYAAMATSASRGAVRDVTQLQSK